MHGLGGNVEFVKNSQSVGENVEKFVKKWRIVAGGIRFSKELNSDDIFKLKIMHKLVKNV
jgi:hypothetical protein